MSMPVESRDDLVKRLHYTAQFAEGRLEDELLEAATRIASDAKRIAELEAERDGLHEARRWTIDRDGADLLICEGNHHRSEECEFTRYIPAITAERALAEERERYQWRTIDSAPKDGTLIDVLVGGEFPRRVTDVEWREPSDSEWWVHGGDTIETPAATWHDCFGPLGKDEQPTHWRRLPEHPSKEFGS